MSLAGFRASNHPQQTAKNGANDDVDDRGTDPAFMATLEERFGAFDLDVAAASHNTKAPVYYTREMDGLTRHWTGRVWCNPPYSDCRAWVQKAWDEWNTGPGYDPQGRDGARPELIVMLLPANRVEQGWWQDLVEPYRDQGYDSPLRVEFLRGRMRFDRPGWTPGPKGDRPPFGCALLIWNETRAPGTDADPAELRRRIDNLEGHAPGTDRLCSQCGELMAVMVKVGTQDGWCAACLDEAAEPAARAELDALVEKLRALVRV